MNMLGDGVAFDAVGQYVIRVFGLSVGFVGDTALAPGTEVIRRGSGAGAGIVRLLVRDGCVRGATLVGPVDELRAIARLIQQHTRVDRYVTRLADADLDLNEVVGSAPGVSVHHKGGPE